jgi:hypothetical protein
MWGPAAEDFRGHFPEAADAVDGWNVWAKDYQGLSERRDLAVREQTIHALGNPDAGLRQLLYLVSVGEIRVSDICWAVSGGAIQTQFPPPRDPVYVFPVPPEPADYERILSNIWRAVSEVEQQPVIQDWIKCYTTLNDLRDETLRLLEDAYATTTLSGQCQHCP